MKLPRAARRQASRVRIALALLHSAYFIQSAGPWHERDFADVQIRRKVVPVFSEDRSGAGIPISQLAWRRAQHRMTVGIPRCRRRWGPLRRATTASLLGKRRHREQSEEDKNRKSAAHQFLLTVSCFRWSLRQVSYPCWPDRQIGHYRGTRHPSRECLRRSPHRLFSKSSLSSLVSR